MNKKLQLVNNCLLFMAVSIYFGTGWSTAIFEFPVIKLLDVDNYYLHFIPQIDAATNFFTALVTLMIVTGLIMLKCEWRTRYRWLPMAVLAMVVGATCLTYFVVFPVNDLLRAGVTDQSTLVELMARWKFLTQIRVAVWSLEWLAMIYYFGSKIYRLEEAR